MPLKVTFELSDKDLDFFKEKASEVAQRAVEKGESVLVAAAKELLTEMKDQEAPAFVKERASKLARLIDMTEDAEWQLEGTDRERVLKAVAYFAEPQDLIPDMIPGLGFLDDAIMIELVVGELRHEIDAYDDFCSFRTRGRKLKGQKEGPVSSGDWLALRRNQLHERMRRRRRRDGQQTSDSGARSPFNMW